MKIETTWSRDLVPHTTVENSSNVASYGYDQAKLLLEVRFQSGGVYQHFGVLPEHYAQFVKAELKGKHYHKEILGKYTTLKVEPETEDEAEGEQR